MVWSSFLLFLLSPSLSSSSFHQDGPCNEGKLWSLLTGQRFAALMNGRNTRRAECAPSFLFASPQKPQDASWRRPPPSIAVSSLVKGGIKRRQRGKVIFLSCLSILLVGFFHFLLCTFIKLIIILVRGPQVRTNGVFVPFSLQPSPVSGKNEVILQFGLPLLQMQCESQMCLLLVPNPFNNLIYWCIFWISSEHVRTVKGR